MKQVNSLKSPQINEKNHEFRLDEVDRKILSSLIEDARISYSALAKKVGLSRISVRKRVTELVKAGVIERFTIQIPSKFMKKPLPVFLNLQFTPNSISDAAMEISKHPDIVIVNQMSGRNNLHVHGFFHDIDDVYEFIENYISRLKGIREISIEFLIKRYKSQRSFLV
ncbi:MAG: Lrp/AsnC family transcriptional regulator [Spirochaetes bacterium]|nr:MAG: Lrp/AsnC family transcriptional regulator [Spirochaetota bacterium]